MLQQCCNGSASPQSPNYKTPKIQNTPIPEITHTHLSIADALIRCTTSTPEIVLQAALSTIHRDTQLTIDTYTLQNPSKPSETLIPRSDKTDWFIQTHSFGTKETPRSLSTSLHHRNLAISPHTLPTFCYNP